MRPLFFYVKCCLCLSSLNNPTNNFKLHIDIFYIDATIEASIKLEGEKKWVT